MDVIVDIPAVRAGRYAATVSAASIGDVVRELRDLLRGARRSQLPEGIRLDVSLGALDIAILADAIRGLAGEWPFLGFRMLAAPPACRLEVTGQGPAAGLARVVFGEIAAG